MGLLGGGIAHFERMPKRLPKKTEIQQRPIPL
jgi:hypothetical protein